METDQPEEQAEKGEEEKRKTDQPEEQADRPTPPPPRPVGEEEEEEPLEGFLDSNLFDASSREPTAA